MAKLIIECSTNGEALELLENILCAIKEAELQSFKDLLVETERKDFEKADFYNDEFNKFRKLGRQIRDRARVEI